jgi:hypothetical protein
MEWTPAKATFVYDFEHPLHSGTDALRQPDTLPLPIFVRRSGKPTIFFSPRRCGESNLASQGNRKTFEFDVLGGRSIMQIGLAAIPGFNSCCLE